jgi:anti-sigma regulatory factor (Ser/Thr protein kinase)
VPEPRLDLPLEQRPLGGMGIHLARTLTDGLDHRILPDGGNETTLTKLLRPAAARETDDGHHDGATES